MVQMHEALGGLEAHLHGDLVAVEQDGGNLGVFGQVYGQPVALAGCQKECGVRV